MLPPDFLEQLRSVYPRRNGDQGWGKVRTLVPREIAKGASWDRILAGARNYAKHCMETGKTGTEYVKQAATFFGRDQWFEEWADMDVRTPAEIAADQKWAALEQRGAAVGCSVSRSRPMAQESERVNAAEREAMQRQWRERGLDRPKFAVIK